MKIRTQEELVSLLDDDYTWRFFEILTIQDTIRKANNIKKRCYLRAGIAMLYAHWEGFIKYSAESYLIFVATKKYQLYKLRFPFVGLAFKARINTVANLKRSSSYADCIQFILENMNKRMPIPYKNTIQTYSNLNSKVFNEIVNTIGLSYKVYQLKEKIIDGKLLYYRNSISHGNYLEIDEKGYNDLQEYVLNILSTFKEQIMNSVQNKEFLA